MGRVPITDGQMSADTLSVGSTARYSAIDHELDEELVKIAYEGNRSAELVG